MYIRDKYHITFTSLYLRHVCAEEQTRRESFLVVNKLCKLATESHEMCSPGHFFFFGVFFMTKSCYFFIVGIFSVFSRQNFVLYFYDHFHFL